MSISKKRKNFIWFSVNVLFFVSNTFRTVNASSYSGSEKALKLCIY